ncbi:MAG: hypothetical protein GY852_06520 [bacterium]|nr:hypothetical protein [bacterium]
MTEFIDQSADTGFTEKEKMEMLENWFQRRTEMTAKALKFILLPVIGVIIFAGTFWFQMYIPLSPVILLALLGASLLAWVICLFAGGGILKRVRTGDSIMLRKIRSSTNSLKS